MRKVLMILVFITVFIAACTKKVVDEQVISKESNEKEITSLSFFNTEEKNC